MKPGTVTKLYTRNKTMSKNFDGDVMSENCDVIVILSIYGQESAKFMFSLIVTFYLTKNENGTKKSLTQLSQYCFE